MGRNADETVVMTRRLHRKAPHRQELLFTLKTHKQGNTAFSSQFSSESHLLQLKKGKLLHKLGLSSTRGLQVALSAGSVLGTITKTKTCRAGPCALKADDLGERGKEKYPDPACMCLVGQSTGGESQKRNPDLPLGPPAHGTSCWLLS